MSAVPFVKPKPRLITVGRGRGKVPPQIPPQSRLGLALQLGAVRQEENPGDPTPTPSQEDQFEKMKEELEFLKKRENDKDLQIKRLKSELDKVKEDFAVFEEKSGASMEMLKKQVENLKKENDDVNDKDLKIQRLILRFSEDSQKLLLDRHANIQSKKETGNVLPRASPPPSLPSVGHSEMKTSHMKVPKASAGAILGKGGQKIKGIRAESGANVWLDDVVDGQRLVTIVGTAAR